jgi:tripartite-type tricarboxylate transporter receptor subunit TctC
MHLAFLHRTLAAGLMAGLGAWGAGLPAAAQTPFPQARPISLVVPFAPGGGNDILARAIGPQMGRQLGQPVVVENKPGAGGNIGTDFVARAPADGHTVVIASSQITMNPFLGMRVPFRIESDFEPVGRIASVPVVLVAGVQQPYKNFEEFLAHARANPAQVAYSSPGIGTPQHLAGEVFSKMSKAELLHVPYKGTGPSIADVLAGQVQVSFATYASVAPFLQAGRLRALGVAGSKRTRLLPELPTFGEMGLKGYDASLWYSLLVPARTPRPVVDKLHQAMRGAITDAAVAKQLSEQGFEVEPSSPDELKTFMNAELARWERVIRDHNIRVVN